MSLREVRCKQCRCFMSTAPPLRVFEFPVLKNSAELPSVKIHHMRHCLRVILSAVLAVATAASCGYARAAEPKSASPLGSVPGPTVVEFLLSTAVSEFRTPGRVRAISFRNVQVGYFADTGPGRYVLCGNVEVAKTQGSEWIQFATIQTSGYEQWLGGVAASICASSYVRWYPGDYSPELLKRL